MTRPYRTLSRRARNRRLQLLIDPEAQRAKERTSNRNAQARKRGAVQCDECGCYDDFHTPACPVFIGLVHALAGGISTREIHNGQGTV